MKKSSFIFTTLLFVFVATFMVLALGYPRHARLVPLVIGLPTLALLAYIVMGESIAPGLLSRFETDLTRGASKKPPGPVGDVSDGLPGDSKPVERAERPALHRGYWKAVAIIIIWMILLLAVVFFFGLLVGLPLFMLMYLKKEAHASWFTTLLTTAIASVSFYVFFGLLWGGQLFSGILFGGYVPPL